MESLDFHRSPSMMAVGEEGIAYWTRWQVPVCALIVVAPAVAAAVAIARAKPDPLRSEDLWIPSWRKIHPFWLLAYRALALLPLSFLLFETVRFRGVSVFYFYTQWTFTLVIIYFLIATLISARGCWIHSKDYISENEEVRRLLERDYEENLPASLTSTLIGNKNSTKLQDDQERGETKETAGFLGHMMQIVYQTSAGAVMLTDIVFWCLLVPWSSSQYFKLNVVKACVHSLNIVFLLLDTALNSLPFPAFRMAYFVLWSCAYIIFQWVLHACGFSRWPYPFLELATPWAPLWYLGMALVHIPCYGMYSLIVKAKKSISQSFTADSHTRSY